MWDGMQTLEYNRNTCGMECKHWNLIGIHVGWNANTGIGIRNGIHVGWNANTGIGIRNGNAEAQFFGFGGKIGVDGVEINTPYFGFNICSVM